jgi:quercetin dioxygenase-like cupin family protein
MNTSNKTGGSNIDPAASHDLKKLVDYSEGSTVSRILYKSDSGSLTLFGFDAGQSLSEHTAPYDAIVEVLDGSVELTVGGKKITAKAGKLVIMPANIPHGLYAIERFKMLLTMIRDKKDK